MAAPLSEKNANVMMDVTMQAQMLHDGDEEPQCQDQHGPAKKVKSMEYHRQVLSGRLAQAKADGEKQYVSPSDGLMSPCTAKLSALRNKKMDKSVKPKSLFQKASARNLGSGGSLFDSRPIASAIPQQQSGVPVNSASVDPEPGQDGEMET